MGPSRISRNIFSMDVQRAIEDSQLPEGERLPLNNFIITSTGDVKVLSPVEQLVWQKLGHLYLVRQFVFNVNDDKLKHLIDKDPSNPTLKANVEYLKLRGRLNLTSNEKPGQKELREKIQTMQKRLDENNK